MLSDEDIKNSFEYVENFTNKELLSNDLCSDESNAIYSNENVSDDKVLPSADIYTFDLNHNIVDELEKLISSGHICHEEINSSLIELLKNSDQDIAINVLKQIKLKPIEENSTKSLINIITSLTPGQNCNHNSVESQNEKQLTSNTNDSTSNDVKSEDNTNASKQNFTETKGPDEKTLQEILDRTGYSHSITSGQRKFGGPPPDWDGPSPPTGSEIYVGKIPRDIYEDKLIPLFEECGKIWDFRLMLDPITGLSKGFAFLQFADKETALAAVKKLNNYEIRPGKALKMNISIPNLRLFVGNIPKSKSKEEIYAEFSKLTEGLINVIVYATPGEKRKNRGFCFLEYQTHLAASVAKKRLGSGGSTKPRVWNCDIIVEWADVQDEPNEEIMAKVKVLYVRNLALSVTEANLREAFEKFGKVEHVKKLKDYAFVHYAERENALKAMEELQGTAELPGGSGIPIEISLAKPPSEKRLQEKKFRELERKTTLAIYPPGFYGGALGFAPHHPSLINGINAAAHPGLYGSPNGGLNGIAANVVSLNPRYINANGYSQYVVENLAQNITGGNMRGSGISYYPPKVVEECEYEYYNAYPTNYYAPVAAPNLNQNGGTHLMEYPQNGTPAGGANCLSQNISANLPPHPAPGYALYHFKPSYHTVTVNGSNTTRPNQQDQVSQAYHHRSSNGHYHNNNMNRNNVNRPPLLPQPQLHHHPTLPLLAATSALPHAIYGNLRKATNYQNGGRHHKNLQETYAAT